MNVRSQEGAITGAIAILAAALLACAGLAYDGGAIITASVSARDVASAAARTGAQQLDPAAIHAGTTALDPIAAREAADRFLTQAGHRGIVTVNGATVTVTVTTTMQFRLLPLGTRTVAATASATAVSDVLVEP